MFRLSAIRVITTAIVCCVAFALHSGCSDDGTVSAPVVFDGKLYQITVNGKIGYIDEAGAIRIQPQYDIAGPFSDGRASVKVGDVFGYIDQNGSIVIEPQYEAALKFSDRRAGVQIGPIWHIIDTEGNRVGNLEFDQFKPFAGGYSAVGIFNDTTSLLEYGYINTNAELVIPAIYNLTLSFSEGLAGVRSTFPRERKTGFINTAGDFVFEGDFALAEPRNYSEGLTWARFTGEGISYIDTEGNKAFPQEFVFASDFRDGLAAVSSDGLAFGYIDKTGSTVIPQQFRQVGAFSDGLAPATLDSLFGYIDRTGQYVIEPTFREAHSFENGIARVSNFNDNREQITGYINTNGDFIYEPTR